MEYVHSNGEIIETELEALLQDSPRTILYFYPKDNTPGCTIEAKDFSSLLEEFTALNTQII
jgi:peroxiredoxin Q/BCP